MDAFIRETMRKLREENPRHFAFWLAEARRVHGPCGEKDCPVCAGIAEVIGETENVGDKRH